MTTLVKHNRKEVTRKEVTGVVIGNKMEKTVVVKVTKRQKHPKYQKVVARTKKYYAHDESNALEVGQQVRLMETRPLSKLKRWRVVEAMGNVEPSTSMEKEGV